MERRGFLRLFGIGAAAATATAFVPFVVPASMKVPSLDTSWPIKPAMQPVVPAPRPPKGKKVWMFGSIYSMLRIQIAPDKAIQFLNGRYWTEDKRVAGAVTLALSKSVAGIHHGGGQPGPASRGFADGSLLSDTPGKGSAEFQPVRSGTCGWEIKTKEDLERLQSVYVGTRRDSYGEEG